MKISKRPPAVVFDDLSVGDVFTCPSGAVWVKTSSVKPKAFRLDIVDTAPEYFHRSTRVVPHPHAVLVLEPEAP